MAVTLAECPTSDDIRAMARTENVHNYIRFFDNEHEFRAYVRSIDDIAGYDNFQTHVYRVNFTAFGLSESTARYLSRMEMFVDVIIGVFLDTAPHGYTSILLIWCPVTRMAFACMNAQSA